MPLDSAEKRRAAAMAELKRIGVQFFVPAFMKIPRSPGYAIRPNDTLHYLPLGVFCKVLGTDAMATLKVSMMLMYTRDIRLGHVGGVGTLLAESAQG
jgi:hypothetical protein